MVTVQGEIVIDRPREEVFDLVADEENDPRYNPQMRLAKKTSQGPIGVGTTFRADMTRRGLVVPMTVSSPSSTDLAGSRNGSTWRPWISPAG